MVEKLLQKVHTMCTGSIPTAACKSRRVRGLAGVKYSGYSEEQQSMQARGSTFALKSTADHLRCHQNSKTGVSMAPQKELISSKLF